MNKHGNPSGRTRYVIDAVTGRETQLLAAGYFHKRTDAEKWIHLFDNAHGSGTDYVVKVVKVAR